jgi:hypothetical protein
MKKSPLIPVLIGVLFVSAVFNFVAVIFHRQNLKDLVPLRGQFQVVANDQNLMNAMITEALQFSKANPAIDPTLIALGIKSNTAAPATATRPASR